VILQPLADDGDPAAFLKGVADVAGRVL